MGGKREAIAAFHDQIVEMRANGSTWRQVADSLQAAGLDVHFNAIVRYAKAVGLPTDGKPVVTRGTVRVAAQKLLPPPTPRDLPTASQDDPSTDLAESASQPSLEVHSDPSILPASVDEAVVGIERARLTDDPSILQRNWGVVYRWLEDSATPKSGEARQRVEAAVFGLRRFMTEFIPVAHPEPQVPAEAAATQPLGKQRGFDPLPSGPFWEPGAPLIHLNDAADVLTLQDSWEGTLVLGATGSGKTSGSGSLLARSFLASHYGGLVLAAKDDEAVLWSGYAAATRRTRQLCVVRPGGDFKLNFLDYQASLSLDRGGSIENVVELFHTILESYSRNKRKADSFWANTARQLLRNLVRVLRAAGNPISFKVIRRFLAEVPISPEDARSGLWRQSETFGKVLTEAKLRSRGQPHQDETDEALRYWSVEFPGLCDETRSIIVMDFVSMADLFFEPSIAELFCGKTTLQPEAVFDGAVIVIDLPVKRYGAVGRIAAVIWKHLFQLAVERRSGANDESRRPVFLWADEAQQFWSDHDGLFQATARSSRCATVYLTQNLPSFYSQVGGELAKERVDGFFGNLCTKIFHCNNDPFTNRWAAEQLGKSTQYRATVSSGDPGDDQRGGIFKNMPWSKWGSRSRVSTSPAIDYDVQPAEFSTLRTGSDKCDRLVDAFVSKAGAKFPSSDKCFIRATFQQEQRR